LKTNHLATLESTRFSQPESRINLLKPRLPKNGGKNVNNAKNAAAQWKKLQNNSAFFVFCLIRFVTNKHTYSWMKCTF
jgi:hypothetical protein